MEFALAQAREVLAATPTVLHTWLTGLSEPWVNSNYGPATFSPFDVIGHLIHGETTDWIPRVRIILNHGESIPFEPFDRYAMYEASKRKSLDELLHTLAGLRAMNLETLDGMQLGPQELNLTGQHPALGLVTLRQLLAAWVVHDLNHIAQIAKGMAHQYAGQVGAWKAYLSILNK